MNGLGGEDSCLLRDPSKDQSAARVSASHKGMAIFLENSSLAGGTNTRAIFKRSSCGQNQGIQTSEAWSVLRQRAHCRTKTTTRGDLTGRSRVRSRRRKSPMLSQPMKGAVSARPLHASAGTRIQKACPFGCPVFGRIVAHCLPRGGPRSRDRLWSMAA